jgi:hypothetical protein
MHHKSLKPKRSQPPRERLFAGWALSREDFMDLMFSLRPYLKDENLDNPDLRFRSCLDMWIFLPSEFTKIHSAQLFFTCQRHCQELNLINAATRGRILPPSEAHFKYSSTIGISEIFIPTRRIENKNATREAGPAEKDRAQLQEFVNLVAKHGGYLDPSKAMFRAVTLNSYGVGSLPIYFVAIC